MFIAYLIKMTTIGLDYGGVISFDPDGWGGTVRDAIARGHEIFIVSHVQPEADELLRTRSEFARKTGAVNLTFSNLIWPTQRLDIAQRKADLCRQNNIEIFIDDDLFLTQEVGRLVDCCATLYIPINLWQIGQRFIDGLDNKNRENNDWRW